MSNKTNLWFEKPEKTKDKKLWRGQNGSDLEMLLNGARLGLVAKPKAGKGFVCQKHLIEPQKNRKLFILLIRKYEQYARNKTTFYICFHVLT